MPKEIKISSIDDIVKFIDIHTQDIEKGDVKLSITTNDVEEIKGILLGIVALRSDIKECHRILDDMRIPGNDLGGTKGLLERIKLLKVPS